MSVSAGAPGWYVDPHNPTVRRWLDQLGSPYADPTASLGIMALVSGAISLVYDVILLAWKQATLGKMLVGTVVRRAADPRLTLGDAFKRQILPAVGSLISLLSSGGSCLSLIDSAWLLWDPKRQTLHDKVAGTVVVLKSTTLLAPRGLR